MKKLKLDKKFKPCLADEGDELFPNGLFEFNITKMLEFIHENKDQIVFKNLEVKSYRRGLSCLNEDTILTAQVSNPIIMAEISPQRYNVIDGNHRLERAYRDGLRKIPAYQLTVTQHLRFLTSVKSYAAYVRYWNEKVAAGVTNTDHRNP